MNDAEFLTANPGYTVLIGQDEIVKVLSFVSGARETEVPTNFQNAKVDTCDIKFVHGE